MYFRRFVIVFTILAYTNFLGLIDSETYRVIIPLKDYALIFVFLYLLNRFKWRKLQLLIFLKPIFVINVLAFIVIISMPFRGDISLISSFKLGRIFFVLLLSFIIYEEILFSQSVKFIYKIIFICAIYYTVLIFINVLAPAFVAKIFIGGRTMITQNSWNLEGERYVIKSNAGILFVYLGFLIKTFEYFITRNRKTMFYSILLFFGVLLQGWRAPLIAVIISVMVVFLRKKAFTKLINLIPIIGLILLLLFNIEKIAEKSIISNKFISTYNEIMGDYSGTLKGRMERSSKYQIPMFLKNKWFGYGFVHKDSKLALKLGYKGAGIYSLYIFDFGYITLLNMFGIIGTILFLFQLLKIFLTSWKKTLTNSNPVYFQTLSAFVLTLLIANYSFGGLFSAVGLLPLAVILGLVQGYSKLNNKTAEQRKLLDN